MVLRQLLVIGASTCVLVAASGSALVVALAIATRSSEGAPPVPGLGTLQPGAPADPAIDRDDPTRDLAALDTLVAVVQDARLYTRETLDAQAARYRNDFDGPFQRRVATPVIRAGLDFMLSRTVGSREDASR